MDIVVRTKAELAGRVYPRRIRPPRLVDKDGVVCTTRDVDDLADAGNLCWTEADARLFPLVVADQVWVLELSGCEGYAELAAVHTTPY